MTDTDDVLKETDESGTEITVASEVLPLTLHLMPLHERPFFPIHNMPLGLSEETWLDTVTDIIETGQLAVGLVLVRPQSGETPDADNFYQVGSAIRMHHLTRKDGQIHFIAEGMQRFRIVKWVSQTPPYLARVEYLAEELDEDNSEIKAYAMAIIAVIKELIPLNPLYNEEFKLYLDRFTPNQPSFLAYFAANLTTASGSELQEVLEAPTLLGRMEKVLTLLKKELEVAKLQAQIREQVEDKMADQQRKFFLREQLKVIQQELGISKDDRTADVERFRGRLEDLELSEAAEQRISDELDKLAVLETGSAEYAVTRNYLDWITGLPWGNYTKDILDLRRARKILDRDHTGLDDVKTRIVEFLAVGKMRGGVLGSIILLVGPPGVGKTSIGRSIAEALGRKFFRFSVGGMRDEAEIKGHRRTYIGAMPGKFVQALKELGSANPVLMLDEVDKIGASYQGDPASALLEVLDPEQNADFLDHYLDVRFDLSRALFICTANQLDSIPGPLLDRMEIIRLSGYIPEEKLQIARQHLWPRQLEKAGVKETRLRISDAAIRRVISGYARQAGVRDLDKLLARVVRKATVKLLGGKKQRSLSVGPRNLEDYLGKPYFTQDKPMAGVGIVTGLAWTSHGGATLDIEASRIHTKNRGFKLTGKLGEVMRESAEIAYSYVTSNLDTYGGDPTFFDEAFVHLHVPEGATPKDGPSAGVTMATALLSLARNQRPRSVAMTGELTLTGQVLAVGGIREKVIAAKRVRVRELVLPEPNRRDIEELPDYLRKDLSISFAKHYRDVMKVVFPE